MNYVEFNERVASSEGEEVTCRICLENDEIQNLIFPCRCSGNSRYVHRQCLNEWRTINRNNRNYTNCDICDYAFQISNNNPSHNCFYRILNYISSDPFLYLMIISLTAYVFSWITYIIDTDYSIINAFFGDTTNMDVSTIKNYYFIFILTFIMCLEIVVILFCFLFIKNKALYCTTFKENFPTYIYSGIMCGLIYMLFGLFYLFVSLEIFSLFICKNHIDSIKRIYDEDSLSTIQNYNPENDIINTP